MNTFWPKILIKKKIVSESYCSTFQVSMLSVCVCFPGIDHNIMLLAHLILSLLNSSFLSSLFVFPSYTHFSFPHTWYWQPPSGTQCIQRMFLAFFPLLNSFSSLLFAASVICSYSHVSRSLFGHFLFRQGLTSAKSVQIWQTIKVHHPGSLRIQYTTWEGMFVIHTSTAQHSTAKHLKQ